MVRVNDGYESIYLKTLLSVKATRDARERFLCFLSIDFYFVVFLLFHI